MPLSGPRAPSTNFSWFGTRPLPVIGAAAAMALLGVPVPTELAESTSLLVRALFNLLHFPLFAVVTFIACRGFGCRTLKDYAWATLAALLVSVGTEVAQTLTTSREASWSDVVTDMLGALAGMGSWAWVSMRPRTFGLGSVSAALVVVTCATLAGVPLITPFRIHLAHQRAFPELYNGNFPGTELLVESLADLDDVELATRDGRLYIKLVKGDYRGVVFWHFPADWRGFARLAIEVENLEERPLPIELQILDLESADAEDDRFNARRELAPKENAVLEFDLADVEGGPRLRPMSMGKIAILALHRYAPGSDYFSVRSIRLE
jgi:VanZ family protein